MARAIGKNAIWSLLLADVKAMNLYMNQVSAEIFSSFDTGNKPSERAPERFYHGFVLGLMVELVDKYVITSNRESGFGRYDIMPEPRNTENDGIIIEFKVNNPKREKNPEDIVQPHCSRLKRRGMRPCCWTRNSQWNKCKSAALRSLKNRC